jgi:hypothetical protein
MKASRRTGEHGRVTLLWHTAGADGESCGSPPALSACGAAIAAIDVAAHIEQDALDAAVFQILDVLDGYDAVYDGWESPIVSQTPQR